MAKEIKAFITNDSFIDNLSGAVSVLYELSDIAYTYSKAKQQYYSTEDPLFSLHLFKMSELTFLTQDEVNNIIRVVSSLSNFLTTNQITNKQQIIISFSNTYNANNPTANISNLIYNNVVNIGSIKSVDYLSFTVNNINCEIWLSDAMFREFYPYYDINIILPFNDFPNTVNNPNEFITALDNFDLLEFNARIEDNKNNEPTTYSKILNIPYKIPNTNTYKNCYFGFNIYGLQGNYDYILRLKLHEYLLNTVGLSSSNIESIFPSILNINEFFITPRWNKLAIPSQVGQVGINSQIALAFNEAFDMDKFIKIYTDMDFLKTNTYNVPFDYNNILLYITNGYYTEASIKDFKNYFSDFITVTSTHPDFARMSLRTQKLVTLLENMLFVSDCNNSTELFNNIIGNSNYNFTIINRGGVNYISYFYDKHQFYMIPKYEFLSLL